MVSTGGLGFFGQKKSMPETQEAESVRYSSVGGKITSATGPRIGSANSMPNSAELLFLKRLLFLKASIENEVTLDPTSV